MKRNNQIKNNELGSIGIGAMIVFIALILVAAVASAVIIQTGEKLQQNAQQSGSDTQQEISGKISVNSVFVFDPDDSYLLYFETAPGSEVITAANVQFQLTCEDTNGNYEYVSGDFTNADDVDDVGDGNGDGPVDNLLPGVSYSFVMDADTAAAASCDALSVGVNGEVTLWIHVEGGGSTYETLYLSDTTRGTLVI
tara:strand:+ start:3486 stop:4073 length:588 start_codon:yes stop_codon:yes gene_type:complete